MPDLTRGFIKFGYFVPIHTYISHKTGSKPFSWPMEFGEKWRE